MFVEEFEEPEFNGNKGRDVFVKEILDILEPITPEELDEISNLLDDF